MMAERFDTASACIATEMEVDALPLYSQEESSLQKMDYAVQTVHVSTREDSAPAASAPPKNTLPLLFGPENSVTTCLYCQCSVRTTIKHTITSRTHLAAAICCFICCCCCIPYCSNSAKNTDHYCPNCFKYLGTYEK